MEMDKNKMGNKIKENKKRFFYPNEFDKMFEFLNKNGKFTAELGINTGGRVNELRGFIKNPLFDTQRNKKILTETKGRYTKEERKKGNTKKPEPRTIPLSKKYFSKLKRIYKSHRVLSTNAFNIQLKKASEEAKIKDPEQFSSHNIRKTFATWMLSLGIPPSKVAQHLGHTEKVLFQSYATNDLFNTQDKDRMVEIWEDLPKRLLPDMRYFR